MYMWYSTGQLAKLLHVSSQTIRRRVADGTYPSKTTAGGHNRVKYINTNDKIICYTRVSSSKQKQSLTNQKELLLKKYPENENTTYISDIASSFNFKRKGLQTILEYAMQGYSIKLVATSQDRVARSGFEIIKYIIELSGGKIIILDQHNDKKKAGKQEFNTEELVSFITSFCNSYYGKRSAKIRKLQRKSRNNCIKKNKIANK